MNSKIFCDDIKVDDYIGHGSSGVVFSCQYKDNRYAYKEFSCEDNYKAFVQPRLEKISQFYGNPNFVFPYKFVYKDPKDKLCDGYLMDCVSEYDKLCNFKLDYNQKIYILNKARKLLDTLHKDYKHLHTDINSWNFLYNQTQDDIILIDFDTCIDLTKSENTDILHLNDLAKIYCKYNGTDIGLDIFLFNLLTFSILNNVGFYDVINNIFDGNYGCITSNGAIDILRDYDDIEFNTLKKKYVIDYL